MVNQIIRYFRLFDLKQHATKKEVVAPPDGGNAPGGNLSIWDIAHFFCLLLGIVAYPFVKAFQSGAPASFEISIPLIVFSFIVAVAIFPAVFKKSFNVNEPRLIQLCMTFAAGLGYQSLFMTVVK